MKYLGRLLTATNNYWPTVIANLHKDRKIWSRLARILGREVAGTWKSRHFYVVVAQAILLFRLDTWVATPLIKQIWGLGPPQGGASDLREDDLVSDGGVVGIP